MPKFVRIPVAELASDTLNALLEEFASRDGTDYGAEETPLLSRVDQLRRQLESGDVALLFELDEERWDILPSADADALIASASADTNASTDVDQ